MPPTLTICKSAKYLVSHSLFQHMSRCPPIPTNHHFRASTKANSNSTDP
ncbi:uncharacterized protein CLUP02_12272 [Colletotrichum lupini]|uniref:Uncharacterized protein n=1 Tax=Colletotrichum lupini TaxID=145971 RepID=A0A9Q8T0Y6_9PEZI|nr:uncharacterized protein CLUP02_12272 [Colletotrichum lupini]UQC86770.1 hypothetical protein CLUP02_12272 [Colletotrichum lupini]